MQYKIGDRVIIKTECMMAKEFGGEGWRDELSCGWTDHLEAFAQNNNRILKITGIIDDEIYKVEGNGSWWSEDMILCRDYNYGEMIEVSQDGKGWVKRVFIGIAYDLPYPVLVFSESSETAVGYKYTRNVAPVDVILIQNGKPLHLTDDVIKKIRSLIHG